MSRFVFTLFDEVPYVLQPNSEITYACYQRETAPSTGKLHWQGYIELKKRKRLSTVIKLVSEKLGWKKFHLDVARGTPQENKDYCSKTESSVPGTFQEFGTPMVISQGKRSDIVEATDKLKSGSSVADIILSNPKLLIYHKHLTTFHSMITKPVHRPNLSVYYYWGPPGVGKSRHVYQMAPEAYRPLVAAPNIWFEGYTGEDTIIIDDIDFRLFPREFILNLLDIYPLRVPQKGSSTPAKFTTIYITSNINPKLYDKALQRRLSPQEFLSHGDGD